ncbi:MAG: hypothetical protein ACON4Z_14780, partial [Planctomycetota bacterium]
AQRALRVSDDPAGAVVLASFALRTDPGAAWQTTAPGAAVALEVDADGRLRAAGVEQGVTLAARVSSVGALLTPVGGGVSPPPATTLLVPVYGLDPAGRVACGFAFAQAALVGATLTVTRLPSAVLPSGASSTSPAALDARLALDANASLRALHTSFAEPVLAPVLRR